MILQVGRVCTVIVLLFRADDTEVRGSVSQELV